MEPAFAKATADRLVVCNPQKASSTLYEPRRAQETPLYQLLESHYEEVKANWEDRFERVYGFWRGFVDKVVFRYLDCGILQPRTSW